MEFAERRAAQYVADVLRAFYTTNFFFPYAAPLTQISVPLRGQCVNGTSSGLLPWVATTGANPSPCTHAAFSAQILNWFNTNRWGDYLFYAVAPDCTQASPGTAADCGPGSGVRLGAGGAGNARALVIGAGAPIASAPFAPSRGVAQVRPSTLVADYLDSIENSNGNSLFDSPTTSISRNYNDKITVVAP